MLVFMWLKQSCYCGELQWLVKANSCAQHHCSFRALQHKLFSMHAWGTNLDVFMLKCLALFRKRCAYQMH
jgi:hypothetical protein